MQMGDVALAFQDPSSLELDVLPDVEEAPPSAEEHRYELNLEFVEEAFIESAWNDDEHVPLARCTLRLGHGTIHVWRVGDVRPLLFVERCV